MKKVLRLFVLSFNYLLWCFKPKWSTRFITWYFKRNGMVINGVPNYLSAKIWFDGSDYSLIELNEGCTISSNVRVLTHDWSLYTVGRAMGLEMDRPVGIFRRVVVGRYAFIGTGSILMPGCEIGEGAIIGAGTVVRGKIEPFTIVIGNPCEAIGSSRDYVSKKLAALDEGLDTLDRR